MRNYDLSKEQSVLGNLLSEDAKAVIPKVVNIFGNLGKNVFHDENNRLIYDAILQLHDQAHPIHPKTLGPYLREKSKRDIPDAELILLLGHDLGSGITEIFAKELKGLAIRREIERLGLQIAQKIEDGTGICELVIACIMSRMAVSRPPGVSIRMMTACAPSSSACSMPRLI